MITVACSVVDQTNVMILDYQMSILVDVAQLIDLGKS